MDWMTPHDISVFLAKARAANVRVQVAGVDVPIDDVRWDRGGDVYRLQLAEDTDEYRAAVTALSSKPAP